MLKESYQLLDEMFEDLVEFRRDMHRNPELSFQEVETPKKIANYLEGLGLEVKKNVGGRGVTAILRGGKPGKTIGLRADFDALPIQDEKEVDYKSTVPGVMHACGHDIHTASLLGAATVLSKLKDQLSGNVVFIHQFAEEQIPGGAKSMIEDGCLEEVDVIYGAHVWSTLPLGTIGVIEKDAMAAGDSFEIKIQGKGGHGAKPHVTVDSVLVGSQIVNSLHQIVSRRIDPQKSAVLTVGTFEAGQAFNIIADRSTLTGTVRTFDEDVRNEMEKSIKQVCESTATSFGASAKVEYVRGYPAVWNHPEQTENVRRAASNVVGENNVRFPAPSMGMEDFAYYLLEKPGAFFFVGGGNEEIGATYPHHHPKFNVDEHSIINIGRTFLELVLTNEEVV